MTIDHILREERSRRTAMWRGLRGQCPQCGTKTLFRKYLKISDTCNACGLALSGHQADDAPPYFTIFFLAEEPPLALNARLCPMPAGAVIVRY